MEGVFALFLASLTGKEKEALKKQCIHKYFVLKACMVGIAKTGFVYYAECMRRPTADVEYTCNVTE